jgi:hypothetical protein
MAAPGAYKTDTRRRSILLWYSGADTRVLERCPTDRIRYMGLGGAVLFTATLAGVSMFDAVHMALHVPTWVQVGVAVIWFLGISNLDRWLVTSMSRGHVQAGPWDDPVSDRGSLRMALPRIGMALLFGFLISTPLMLQIFDPEIQQQIQVIHQNELDAHQKQADKGATGRLIAQRMARRDALNKVIESKGLTPDVESDPDVKALESKLADLNTKYADYSQKAACEDAGTKVKVAACDGTSGKQGQGTWFAYYTRQAKNTKTQINTVNGQLNARKQQIVSGAKAKAGTAVANAKSELPTVLAELKTAQDAQDRATTGYNRSVQNSVGLLIRIQALIKASKGSPITFVVQLLLWAFLMLIDCLPVIVKLASAPGTYEKLLARQQEIDEAEGKWAQRAEQRATRFYTDAMAAERETKIGALARREAKKEYRLRKARLHDHYERVGRRTKDKRRWLRPGDAGETGPQRHAGPKGPGPRGPGSQRPKSTPKHRAPSRDWPSAESAHREYTEGGLVNGFLSRVFWLRKRYEGPGR